MEGASYVYKPIPALTLAAVILIGVGLVGFAIGWIGGWTAFKAAFIGLGMFGVGQMYATSVIANRYQMYRIAHAGRDELPW